jgi:hypothetical protein
MILNGMRTWIGRFMFVLFGYFWKADMMNYLKYLSQ